MISLKSGKHNTSDAESRRKTSVLELILHLAGQAGFPGLVIQGNKVLTRVKASGGQIIVFILAEGNTTEVSDALQDKEIYVYIYDESNPAIADLTPQGPSKSWIQTIFEAAAQGQPRDLRLSTDMLFPFLEEKIHLYIKELEKRVERFDPCLSSATGDIYQYIEISGGKMGQYNLDPVSASLHDFFQSAIKNRRTLCAIEAGSEPATILTRTAIQHAIHYKEQKDLYNVLPLMVFAHQIRSIGLLNAVSDALTKEYGLLFTPDILKLIISLGYIHLYVPGVECWRTAEDLDPNTIYFAEFLATAGSQGRFTLGCSREDILHYMPAQDGKNNLENPEVLTTGDRFIRDPMLSLIELHRLGERTVATNITNRNPEDYLHQCARDIAKLSRNLLTEEESARLLQNMAIQDLSTGGTPLMRSDIAPIIRQIVKGDRGRLANIVAIEAALLISGPLEIHSGEFVTFGSDAFREWLISRALSKALKVFLESGRKDFLGSILSTRGLSWRILENGLSGANLGDPSKALKAMPSILHQFGFSETAGGESEGVVERQNLLRILTSCVSRGRASDSVSTQERINSLMDVNRKMKNQAMCQSFFKDFDLRKWTFDECDLRSSVFKGCNLDGTQFIDSFLGGIMFIECEFGQETNFMRSDLSGSIIQNKKNDLGFGCINNSGLEGINITAAEIWDSVHGQDLMQRLNDVDALMLNTNINGELYEFSDQYQLARASAFWGDHSPVITPVNRELLKGVDATNKVAGWPGGEPLAITAVETRDGKEVLIAEHAEKGLYIGGIGANWVPAGSSCPAIPHIPITIKPITNQQGKNEFQIARATVDNSIEKWILRTVNGSFIAERTDKYTFDSSFKPTALLWLCEPNDNTPIALLIGGKQGKVIQFMLEDGRFPSEQHAFRDAEAATVTAMAFAPIQGVAYIAGEDCRIFGYRLEPGKRPLCLFSFHTAHQRITSLEIIRNTGQVIVAGPSRERIEDSGGHTPLFVLANVRGDVLAVWPDGVTPSSKLGDSAELKVLQRIPDKKHSEEIKIEADSYVLRYDNALIYNPCKEQTITIELHSDDTSKRIPSWIRSEGQQRYRVFQAEIINETNSGEFMPHRKLIEADFSISERPASFRLNFHPDFDENIDEARMDLKITYPDPMGCAPILINKNITIKVERDDNPYCGDGTPVEGRQFFGFFEESKECVDKLLQKQHVVLTAPRRSGKTSFLRHVKRRLISQMQKICVEVTGERMASETDFYAEIKSALEELEAERTDYRGITHSLNPSDHEGMLAKASEQIKNKLGQKEPQLIVLVDEWGLIKQNKVLDEKEFFGVTLPEMKNRGIVFCMTSVPNDFPRPKNSRHSDSFRYIGHWIHIGRLEPLDLNELITTPLNTIGYAPSEELLNKIRHITSCAPDDANRVMHYTYAMAQNEFLREAGKLKRKEVLPRHMEGCEEKLIEKYDRMRNYLYDDLSPNHKRWLLDQASQGKPLWDETELVVGTTVETIDPKLLEIYAKHGFTQPCKSEAAHRLWIPYGLTLWLKRQKELEVKQCRN